MNEVTQLKSSGVLEDTPVSKTQHDDRKSDITLPHCLWDINKEKNNDIQKQTIEYPLNGNSITLTRKFDPFLFIPKNTLLSDSFKLLEKWEGKVIECKIDSFTARIVSLTDGIESEYEAEINIKEIFKDDIELVKRGAIFYWSIGYFVKNSVDTKGSIIRFQRLPFWTHKELEKAEADAIEIQNLIDKFVVG